jgi:phage tail-like protein
MGLPDTDFDTSVGWSFGIECDGVQIKNIQEISGLKIEQDVIELKQNTKDGKYNIKKLPGRWKAGEVTLTRGLSGDNSFETWIKTAQAGDMKGARKTGAVIVYDYMGAPIKRYNLTGMWAKSLEIGTLKAGDTSVLTEKMTVTYETIAVA